MKFTEAKLEQAVIELFEAKGYKHFTGGQVRRRASSPKLNVLNTR